MALLEISLNEPWVLPAVGAGGTLLTVGGYWGSRLTVRYRTGVQLRLPRSWRQETLQQWIAAGWLEPGQSGMLPRQLAPAVVFYEWARVDPEIVADWRLRRPVRPETPVEALVGDAWSRLPENARERTRERLAEAIAPATTWWGGAERGWNGRPLSVLSTVVGRKERALPVHPVEDLTAAPLPMALQPEVTPDTGGAELVLALAVLRRSTARFIHPLAPRSDVKTSLVQGLSTKVGSDVGRRIGGGLGAALGPIGSLVGQYLGEMAGRLGGEALAKQALPEPLAGCLRQTESALAELGGLAATEDFVRMARRPADELLDLGKRLENHRSARSRRVLERIWPSRGLILTEEVMRVALDEMNGYRAAAELFVGAARRGPEAVAGGMLLQNPWMVRELPGGVERLNAARAALNRAAIAIGERRPG